MDGGVFGAAGSVGGLGSVLPSDVPNEGFEDLAGFSGPPSPAMAPVSPPMNMPRHPSAVRRPRVMAVRGMGEDATAPMYCPACPSTRNALLGFLAGALVTALGFGVYNWYQEHR